MTLLSLQILDQQKALREISQLRVQSFWHNHFLNESEQCKINRSGKISVYLHYIFLVFAVLALITQCTSSYLPQTIFNENWSDLTKIFLKAFIYFAFLFGYYLAVAHVSLYAHTILHGYFQMKTLTAYLQHEFREYAKIEDEKEKINSYRYQTLIEGALLRCIKQHKRIAA